MQDEIALFIDFENIRYSLLNVQRREPDPQELISIAGRFGTVMVARAYADWGRQPDFFKGSLTAAMIDRVDCPAKVRDRFRQNQNQSQQFYQGTQAPYERRWGQGVESSGEYSYDDARDDSLDEQEMLAGDEGDEGDIGDESGIEMHDDAGNYEQSPDERGESGADDRRRGAEEGYGYQGQPYFPPQQQQPQPSTIITQSTVDLNMLMDIIETVFDRPNINTYVLMTGDRDFTRICARLKHRLSKRVIVCGIPGTVSRDLISAAEQFIPLGIGASQPSYTSGGLNSGPIAPSAPGYQRPYTPGAQYSNQLAPVEPDEPGFIQFLDYIDRHWSWRTVGGVANFIGDPYNPKNRFRGRLTRDTARELLIACIEQDILDDAPDAQGNHNLRLNREHPRVAEVLSELAQRQNYQPYQQFQPYSPQQ